MTSVVMPEPPGPLGPLPPVDEAAMARARAVTEALVRQGKVSGAVGAMVAVSSVSGGAGTSTASR